jgi:hypothetical protein
MQYSHSPPGYCDLDAGAGNIKTGNVADALSRCKLSNSSTNGVVGPDEMAIFKRLPAAGICRRT